MGGYSLMACPTLYPGQVVSGEMGCPTNLDPVTMRVYLRHYNAQDGLTYLYGPEVRIDRAIGPPCEFSWTIPDCEGYPIAEIGLELTSFPINCGDACLDYLTWDGAPEVTFTRTVGGKMWRRAWVNGVEGYFGPILAVL